MKMRQASVATLLLTASSASAFTASEASQRTTSALSAFDEKLRAINELERKNQAQLNKLKRELADMESGDSIGGGGGTSGFAQAGAAAGVASLAVTSGALGGYIVDNSRRDSFYSIVSGMVVPEAVKQMKAPAQAPADAPAAAPAEKVFPATLSKLKEAFPAAVKNKELVDTVEQMLAPYGYGKTTLVATSFCCDEVNRPLETEFSRVFKETFSLGGLAGFPFAGVTGFGAFAKHIPDGGSCVVCYGPHVGVDLDGKVGVINRRGKEKTSTCCGSAVAASGYIDKVFKGEQEPLPGPTEPNDAQQLYVSSMLLPYATRMQKAADPMVELPYATYEPLDALMEKILSKASGKVGGDGKIALIGGIQINTPVGMSDYFMPLRFELRDNGNNILKSFM